MLMLNQPAPDFELPDLSGHLHRLSQYRGQIVVVNFWSAECPWSERADQYIIASMHQLRKQIVYLPVASNVNETLDTMWEAASQRALPRVLRDSGAGLAERWGAQITPHAFVLDAEGVLRYQGAVDDVTFRQKTPTRWYVEEAVDALLAGRRPELQETAPYGCTIVRP